MTPQEKLDALKEKWETFSSACYYGRPYSFSLPGLKCFLDSKLPPCIIENCPRLNRPHDTKEES